MKNRLKNFNEKISAVMGKGKKAHLIRIIAGASAVILALIIANCDNPIVQNWYEKKQPSFRLPADGTLVLMVLPEFEKDYQLQGLFFIDASGGETRAEFMPGNPSSGSWNFPASFSGTYTLAEAEVRLKDGNLLRLPAVGSGGTQKDLVTAIPIGSAEELDAVRGGDGKYPLTWRYIQYADIDLSVYPQWQPLGSGGDTGNDFIGIYEGRNYVISNMNIPGGMKDNDRGLFSRLGKGGKLLNINVVNSTISGGNQVGGLCGQNAGEIIACSFDGTVTGIHWVGGIAGRTLEDAVIDGCSSGGKINNSGGGTGGITGIADVRAVIRNCTNKAAVKGENWTGGIAGHGNTESRIIKCSNFGPVKGSGEVGGIAGGGTDKGEIIACFNNGKVEGTLRVGGIVGIMRNFSISACRNSGKISAAKQFAGGIIGHSFNGKITACYNTGNVGDSEKVGGIAGITDGSSTVTACYSTGEVTGTNMGPNAPNILNLGDIGVHGWIIGENLGAAKSWKACFWGGPDSSYINGVGNPPSRDDAKPFGVAQYNPPDMWPSPKLHPEWGIGDGSGSGKWWQSLGNWNNGKDPEYPKLYWE